MPYWLASTAFGRSLLACPKCQALPPFQKLDVSACLVQHAAQSFRSYANELRRE